MCRKNDMQGIKKCCQYLTMTWTKSKSFMFSTRIITCLTELFTEAVQKISILINDKKFELIKC